MIRKVSHAEAMLSVLCLRTKIDICLQGIPLYLPHNIYCQWLARGAAHLEVSGQPWDASHMGGEGCVEPKMGRAPCGRGIEDRRNAKHHVSCIR